MIEKFSCQEPQWILDQKETGPLFWRRESIHHNNNRVKFRYDVEVKEFYRSDNELEHINFSKFNNESSVITIGVVCILCITITIILPWYIIFGTY